MNKYAEPFAIKGAAGIIAVSKAYNKTLQERYKNITSEKCLTLTFGAFEKDFNILDKNKISNEFFNPKNGLIHIPYIGRAGHDMRFSLSCIFSALKIGLRENHELFKKIRLYYIGTSYAAEGKGIPTVAPLAKQIGVEKYVQESTDRIPYFEALKLLKDANMLIIPGSDDSKYTASKLYNYILSRRPMITVFNEASSVNNILKRMGYQETVQFAHTTNLDDTTVKIYNKLKEMLRKLPYQQVINQEVFKRYSAKELTKQQIRHFEKCLN